MAGAGHVFLYQRGRPGYGRVTVWPELAVFFLGSAPGLVTARQDWSERMAPRASGDTRVERAIKRGEERGPHASRDVLYGGLRVLYVARTPAKMRLVAVR